MCLFDLKFFSSFFQELKKEAKKSPCAVISVYPNCFLLWKYKELTRLHLGSDSFNFWRSSSFGAQPSVTMRFRFWDVRSFLGWAGIYWSARTSGQTRKSIAFEDWRQVSKNRCLREMTGNKKSLDFRLSFVVTQNGKKSNQILKHVIYSQEMIG